MYLSDDQMFHMNQIIRIKEVIAVTGISQLYMKNLILNLSVTIQHFPSQLS
jgi:predicted DNA-binding transcriptional regulator AlpA